MPHSEILELLSTFCQPLGPPGREDEIRQALSNWLQPKVRRLEVDPMGNLQAWLGPEDRPRVMLDAHMDEIAFMVQLVQDSGLLNIAPLGGVDPRIMPASRVILMPESGSHIRGVAGMAPPHVTKASEREKAVPWEKLTIDMGFQTKEQATRAGITIGTTGVVDAGFGPMGNGAFQARNLDDRAGCVVLLALIERLQGKELPVELVFNFAVAEEVGLRGAAAAAFSLAPDLALVVECTMGDTPGLPAAQQPSRMGKGPAVTVADGRIVVPYRLVKSLEEAADRAGVACQRKLPTYGGTDAGVIHMSRGGVPTAVISIPTRYIHSPVSLLYLDDLSATVELTAAWVDGVEELL